MCSDSPIILVGLGNPGLQYEKSRHNFGFYLIDKLASFWGLQWNFEKKRKSELIYSQYLNTPIVLAKPQTYMNESGLAVQSICSFYKVSAQNLIIIYDDITLALGQIKINQPKSSGGHNGLKSILGLVGAGFTAYRLGIGKKIHPEMLLADYVLGLFSKDEVLIIKQQDQQILNGLITLLENKISASKNQ